jgi:uncharacterized membrane protein YozB (DUF420 family)
MVQGEAGSGCFRFWGEYNGVREQWPAVHEPSLPKGKQMTLYNIFLTTHSWLRWVVLIAAVAAVVMAWYGWRGQRPWTQLDNRAGLIFTISLDIQFLLGLILYVGLSPVTTAAFRDLGAAMADAEQRFFVLEHTLYMVLALIMAHVGRVVARRAADDGLRHKWAAIFFSLALFFILLGIPWTLRPWLRLGL